MSLFCSECHWFLTKSRFGREEKSCHDLGEKPDTPSCDRFLKSPRDGNFPEWVQEQVGALLNVRYKDVFHEILAEGFVLEQDAKLSVATVQAQLQIQGAPVVLEGKEFERSIMRLIDIYQVYRMACAIGLGRFVDEIMSAEIKRRFLQHPILSQGRPVTTTVVSGEGGDRQ